MGHEHIIATSKTKLIGLVLGGLALSVAGLWLFRMDVAEIEVQRRFNDPLYVHGTGLACLLFFGLCTVAVAIKLFDRRPGLVLSPAGLLDNSSAFSSVLIPWTDIAGFKVYQVQRQKFLVVQLMDPEKYLARCNPLARTLKRMSFKMSGSPITISSNSLQISFDSLANLCSEYFQSYGSRPP